MQKLKTCFLNCFYINPQKGYDSPTQLLKYTTAGLKVPGENVINDVPFLKKFWLQRELKF